MKKSVLLVSAALTASMVLAACGGGEEAPAKASTPAATAAATQAAATATAAPKTTATASATATATGTAASSAASGTAASQTVNMTTLEDGDKYSFDPASLNLKTGEITFKITNKAGNARPHTIAIRDASGKELGRIDRVASGAVGEGKITVAEAGTYTFFCYLQGHEDRGQRGTLTVTRG